MIDVTLEQIIGHGHFFQQILVNVDAFVRDCKDRDIEVSHEKLERLEKLGLFLPSVRIRWPKIKIKIARREDGQGYEQLGMLEEGENGLEKQKKRSADSSGRTTTMSSG